MSEPKRYTLKKGVFDKIESVEDPEGKWIFDPGHKIELLFKDAEIRLRCAFLDEVCVDCKEDCLVAGGFNNK